MNFLHLPGWTVTAVKESVLHGVCGPFGTVVYEGGSAVIRIVKVKRFPSAADKTSVCYVGRGAWGWSISEWHNPYKVAPPGAGGACQSTMTQNRLTAISECLERFRVYVDRQHSVYLDRLWDACEHGTKPLGCWCVNATLGEWDRCECHGQVLAEMLYDRFCKPGLEAK